MSSRQEEKERRRQEREAQEQKAAAAAARTRRLQIVGGAVLVAAVVVVAAILVSSGGGDDKSGPDRKPTGNTVAIPKRGENAAAGKLDAAAKAAGCEVKTFPNYGSNHVEAKVKYKTNPPTSGDHNQNPASDGIYDADNTPAPENYVHSLEHGRIQIQYKPGTPQRQISQLETLFGEKSDSEYGVPIENGAYTQLLQNNTGMKYAVAAVAWTHLLGCPAFNDKVFDAIRSFRSRYTLQGPEKILQPE
jgi:Protein of unknown function (DUF3105)